jgi:hypothetical protein
MPYPCGFPGICLKKSAQSAQPATAQGTDQHHRRRQTSAVQIEGGTLCREQGSIADDYLQAVGEPARYCARSFR